MTAQGGDAGRRWPRPPRHRTFFAADRPVLPGHGPCFTRPRLCRKLPGHRLVSALWRAGASPCYAPVGADAELHGGGERHGAGQR
jgi:hypothetical protein